RNLIQYTAPQLQWTITDASGAAVNLAGKTIKFKAYTKDGTSIASRFTYSTGAGSVTIGGPSSNKVTVQFSGTDTATLYANLCYELQNTTDKLVLATGSIEMIPGVDFT